MTAVHPHTDDATSLWLARYDDAVAAVLPGYFDVVAHRGEDRG